MPATTGGFLVIQQALAGDAAHDLRRRRALSSSSTGAQIPAYYFTGDGARRDQDGYFWIMGRVDDVLNVSGHRLSTMEVESLWLRHPKSRRGRGRRPAR